MKKYFAFGLLLLGNVMCKVLQTCKITHSGNGCISFTVTQGTGCAWMCNYCANSLGTSNYYFTTPVCTYEPGGCVGNPIAGVEYTCCSA
jgi:hypothetical protein